MRRTITIVASLGAVLLAIHPREAGAVPQQDRGRTASRAVSASSIDTTFRMERGGVVDLSVTFGTITVSGASGSDVRVRASAEDGTVRLRSSPTLASVRASSDRGVARGVRYDVSVPAGVRVVMHTTTGDITVSGVQGDIEVANVHGDIRLTNIAGLAKVETVSGTVTATGLTGGARIEVTSSNVTVTGAEGDISVENTSGRTTLSDIRSRTVRAESVSGAVRFQGAVERSGRYDFSSHSGPIHLTLPPGTGALLSLSTYSGSIGSDFPITLQQGSSDREEKELQFRLGDGSARISAESFSGNITITRGTGRDRQE
jgi:hypothetical protein